MFLSCESRSYRSKKRDRKIIKIFELVDGLTIKTE